MRSQRIKSVAPPVAPSRWGLFFSAAGPGIFPAPQSSGPSCSERRPDRGTPQAHSPDRHRSARQGTQGKPRAPAIFLQHSQCCRFLGLLRRLGGTWPAADAPKGRRRGRSPPRTAHVQPAGAPRSNPHPQRYICHVGQRGKLLATAARMRTPPIGCRWGTWLGCRRRAKRDGRAEWAGSKGPRGTQIPGGDLIRSQRIKSVGHPGVPQRYICHVGKRGKLLARQCPPSRGTQGDRGTQGGT